MGSHDMICFCDHPWLHLLQCLLQRGSQFELSEKEVRILQKCLLSTAKDGTATTTKEEETRTENKDSGFDLDVGDLEELFKEDEKQG